MPIRAERQHLYPGGSIKSKEWQAIRKRIGERSDWRCETCGAPHMTMIARGTYRSRDAYMVLETCKVFCAETGLHMATMRCTSEFASKKVLKIVLTVAHLDHDEASDADENLAHLCQRHHLRHDAKHHERNAARTRRSRGGQLDIEDFL